jgi:hypothetical protein
LDREVEAHALGLLLNVLNDEKAARRHPRLARVLKAEVGRRVAIRWVREHVPDPSRPPPPERDPGVTAPEDDEPSEEAEREPPPAEHPPEEPEPPEGRRTFGASHIPPGMSEEAWRRQWPSGRGK